MVDEKIKGWEIAHFTTPLRSPPSVIKAIEKAVEIQPCHTIPKYSKLNVPDHAHGPHVKQVWHHPQKHLCQRVEDCEVCGREVADFLCTVLNLSAACEYYHGKIVIFRNNLEN